MATEKEACLTLFWSCRAQAAGISLGRDAFKVALFVS
jgi:hypothetical protein